MYVIGLSVIHPGLNGESGVPGESGEKGATGMSGVNGTPGPRGEEGPRGKLGERGSGNVEVFVLHSFNSTVPQCPRTANMLWKGFSAGPSLDGPAPVNTSPLSSPGSCRRSFTLLQTLNNLDSGTASSWHVARDVDGVEDGKTVDAPGAAEKFVARCSVCEVEAKVLAVHSGSTELPPCPEAWETIWTGFTYLTGTVSYQHVCPLWRFSSFLSHYNGLPCPL